VAGLLSRESPESLELASRRADLGVETLDRPRIHHLSGLPLFTGGAPEEELINRKGRK
jgi:hypothetical protein